MFIPHPKNRSGHNRYGEQWAQGRFLLLLQPETDWRGAPLRVLVRHVKLRQLGHFMMGTVVINKQRFTVSGAYGNDGLPMTVPNDIYKLGTELPRVLYDAWNKGGGHNGVGTEGEAMRRWATLAFPNNK